MTRESKFYKALRDIFVGAKVGGEVGVDVPRALSNLLGKNIKKITEGEVEFEDGEKINIRDLDYNVIKSLIWW